MPDPFRQLLLWASTDRFLAHRLPKLGFVRATVARFMPGEDAAAALSAAEALRADGIAAAFTYLGEGITESRQTDSVVEHYLSLIDAYADRRLDAEVSVKPTHLGLDLDRRLAVTNLARIAERATARGSRLWIDMEASGYVQPTIELYRELLDAFPSSGICLQAYLRRTPQDLADLLAVGASVRLVKGAYREPSDLALQRRPAVSSAFRRLAVAAWERKDGEGRLVLGTHDVALLRAIDADIGARGGRRQDVEIEMLFGIRAGDQIAMAGEGYRVRTLVAYGEHWYPWFMRRLAERPSNVLIALRNLAQPASARTLRP